MITALMLRHATNGYKQGVISGRSPGHVQLWPSFQRVVATVAIQIAKSYGTEVTGVDSTKKMEMIRSIGADRVVDYTREDFSKSGGAYDVIFDTVGKGSISRNMRLLNENGVYLLANPKMA
jgi:D-arabinose 1-dehydrogenase-like Zn-dependent alcohol dehydrogenase